MPPFGLGDTTAGAGVAELPLVRPVSLTALIKPEGWGGSDGVLGCLYDMLLPVEQGSILVRVRGTCGRLCWLSSSDRRRISNGTWKEVKKDHGRRRIPSWRWQSDVLGGKRMLERGWTRWCCWGWKRKRDPENNRFIWFILKNVTPVQVLFVPNLSEGKQYCPRHLAQDWLKENLHDCITSCICTHAHS